MEVVPRAERVLPADSELLIIGTTEAEESFLSRWGNSVGPTRRATGQRANVLAQKITLLVD